MGIYSSYYDITIKSNMKSLHKYLQKAKKEGASTKELALIGAMYVISQAKGNPIIAYQPDYYKNEEIVPTIFLRKITHDEICLSMDNILTKCISGWHGFQNEKGEEIRFNKNIISSLPYRCRMELYYKIVEN